MDTATLWVFLVVFFASLIRSTFGFVEGLIAVPLLALIIPIEIAAPVAALFSITIASSWYRTGGRCTCTAAGSDFPGYSARHGSSGASGIAPEIGASPPGTVTT
jgi:hypothetical protein